MNEARRVMGDVERLEFAPDAAAALTGADALVIVTEWKEFKSPDFDFIKSSLRSPVVFDGRNLYDPALMAALSIEYEGIGRRGLK
jgi:UDPglucose 6-dehydrogenase